MKHNKLALVAAMAALPAFSPGEAEAGSCKQYTKTIRIDGRLEVGVGQACERHDGDWEIVSLKGPYQIQERLRHDIYDDLYDRGYRVIVVNNYGYARPYYRTRYVDYYRSSPAYFGFYFGDYDNDRDDHHHKHYKNYGHSDHHGHGNGHRDHH